MTKKLAQAIALTWTVAMVSACGESSPGRAAIDAGLNALTAEEQASGWQLLFDGQTTTGWRGYARETFPEQGWEVRDQSLVVLESGDDEGGLGGDIVTVESFGDFELSLAFKVTPVANSGILYRVIEKDDAPMWHNAPEFQVLDDTAYIEMGTMDMHTHLTGDNYDLHSSTVRAAAPIGEWNSVRILVRGNHVEHWLNGQKTVEYELLSPDWEQLVAGSKFAEYPEYGRAPRGPIGIQDHGHEVSYRNIKIRPITNGRP